MPYFVKVGFEKRNIRKVTSKGYFIKRMKKSIYTEWGAIDVVGLKKRKFSWHKTTMYQIHEFRTIEEALEFKYKKMRELLISGYDQLPSGLLIYKRRVD